MIFYHVSLDSNLDGRILYPRIPLNRLSSENDVIKRICVSSSIVGCLLATPRYRCGDIVTVYTCESSTYYQPTITDVVDVPVSGEIWLLEPICLKYFTKVLMKNEISEFSNKVFINFEFIN